MAFGWLFNDNQTHLIPYSNFLVRLHASVAEKVFLPSTFCALWLFACRLTPLTGGPLDL